MNISQLIIDYLTIRTKFTINAGTCGRIKHFNYEVIVLSFHNVQYTNELQSTYL